MEKIKIVILIITACFTYYSSINAQIKLTHYVIGSGASTITGSVHNTSVTIGQPTIGNTSNFMYSNYIGFWYQYAETITDVKKDNNNGAPIVFQLYQNFPNPFNPSSTIKYSIPEQSKVTLKVFDILGSEVLTLVNDEQSRGNYEVEFEGSKLTSGVYFYRLQVYPDAVGAGDFVKTKKMILLK